jgi:gamma-glutamylcyclotransferase (GGCT)/AIG2-like uncharacterized protein YtfP
MKLCFFYGSLRTGYWNNIRCISPKSKKVGDAETAEKMSLYIGKSDVPTVVPGGSNTVKGEVWSLTPNDAKVVKYLEAGYDEKEVEVVLPDGEVVKAIMYGHDSPQECLYLRGGYDLVPSGDYTQVLNTNRERIS